MHYVEGRPAREAAKSFGYTLSSYYSLMHETRAKLSEGHGVSECFFTQHKPGRKRKDSEGEVEELIVKLRKKYLSVPDIKAIIDTLNIKISETYVYKVITRHGFARLPRRAIQAREETVSTAKIEAPQSEELEFTGERFTTHNTIGILCLLPYIQQFGVDELIKKSNYPETKTIPRLNSILSFVALKLSSVRRYTNDDAWCMDRGLGLFAGLNVLPKAAWFSSYSHRVTRKMNLEFLKCMHKLFADRDLLSDTANLDFTTVPYWGDDSHLENNWSGTRHKALPSILAVLGQDPESGIITYGDTSVRHENKNKVVLEFLDFYSEHPNCDLKYLVFDSQFTTYQNLSKLDDRGILFLTIRKRGKKIVDELKVIPHSQWKNVRVADSSGKGRIIPVVDQVLYLKQYGREIRQVAIAGRNKIKPALIITNDFDLPVEKIIRKYARRWLVEKEISQQIEFFHLNRISSSMVIKVDFDLTMTILAHNILRLFAADLPGYSHLSPSSLFNRFLQNSGHIQIAPPQITVSLRKKRNLPAILSAMEPFQGLKMKSWGGMNFEFCGDTRS